MDLTTPLVDCQTLAVDTQAIMKGSNEGAEAAAPISEEIPTSAKQESPALCRVTGCGVVLLDQSLRNWRVKTCTEHQSTGQVDVGGEAHRFCQQCMRLHTLDRFDGSKRSCRERLNRQNRRRRRKTFDKRQQVKARQANQQIKTGVLDGAGHLCGGRQLNGNADNPQRESSSDVSAAKGVAAKSPPKQRWRFSTSAETEAFVAWRDRNMGGHVAMDSVFQEQLEGWHGPSIDHRDLHFCVGPGCAVCHSQPIRSRLPHPVGAEVGQRMHDYRSCTGMAYRSNCIGLPGELHLPAAHVLSLSLKINNATPHDLPPTLLPDLLHKLQAAPYDVEGFLQPGCVELSIDLWFDNLLDLESAQQRALASFAAQESGNSQLPWGLLHDRLCIRGTKNQEVDNLTLKILDHEPLAVVHGDNLSLHVDIRSAEDVEVVFRHQGGFYCAEETERIGQPDGTAVLTVTAPHDALGFSWLELRSREAGGLTLSNAVPVLLTDSEDVATEIASFKKSAVQAASEESVALLRALGSILYPSQGQQLEASEATRILCVIARCGWPSTLYAAAEAAEDTFTLEAVVLADVLLSSAVVSQCVETVQLVLDLIAGVQDTQQAAVHKAEPFELSALHWAALHGSDQIINVLLELGSDVVQAWQTVRAGPMHLTPAEMRSRQQELLRGSSPVGGSVPLDSEPEVEETCEAASGSSSTALDAPSCVSADQHPPGLVSSVLGYADSKFAIPLTLLLIGGPLWTTPRAQIAVAASFAALAVMLIHFVLPQALQHCYLQPLRKLQGAATAQGLAVTSHLTFENPQVNDDYRSYSLLCYRRLQLSATTPAAAIMLMPGALMSQRLGKLGPWQLAFFFPGLCLLSGWARRPRLRDYRMSSNVQVLAAVSAVCCVVTLLSCAILHGGSLSDRTSVGTKPAIEWGVSLLQDLLGYGVLGALQAVFLPCSMRHLLPTRACVAAVYTSLPVLSFCLQGSHHGLPPALIALHWFLVASALEIVHAALLFSLESRRVNEFLLSRSKDC